MTAPTPETLDWLRQCAAAPGARWHRALLAEVEGQAPPEIEPIPPEGLAWLHQSARVHGATYSQVLLHVLERIELLDQDAIEQSQSNRFTFEAIVRRLERLEAALQQSTCKEFLQVPPTPEPAPVATDEELLAMRSWSSHGPTFDSDLVEFGRAVYDLGRQHGAAAAQPPAAQPAPPVAAAGGLVERVGEAIERNYVIGDIEGSWDAEARAAIREVAYFLGDLGYRAAKADLLEQVADRG
jgi:hypothetical protein